MTDARIVRTRAALHDAIIELATLKPVPSITVSELTRLAGINRVTFYKHFTTPAETLGSALALELDPARERLLESYTAHESSSMDLYISSLDTMLDHIERHRGLYLLAINTPQDGTVPNLLADHLTESFLLTLEQRAQRAQDLPPMDNHVVARFVAHGIVGAIKAWVLNGTTEREPFFRSLALLAPEWWFPES